jgi:choice-of-anchor B domain-containing protein
MLACADDGKARYVAGSGQDSGDCLNKFRPCRSLSYAIAQAGKGDIITVAEGSYELATSQELNDLLTVQGRLDAGYDGFTGFSDRTASGKTLLIGVPPELRERFERDGFTVITDTKSFFETSAERDVREAKSTLATKVRASEQQHKAAPCSGNQSNGFACQGVSLLSHLPLSDLKPAGARGNDVWGFFDLNTGREYALMGLQNGVAVVDITDPSAPEQVAFSTGASTTWRDIKVYQRYDSTAKRWRAYAYATADAVQDFLMVLDLSGLPNSVERVEFSSDFRAAHNSYLVNADYTFGLARRNEVPRLGISGSSLGTPRGSHRFYSLTNPRAPALASTSTQRYSHDMASFAITDARKNAQCVNATSADACEVIADFAETSLDVWDVTISNSPVLLQSQQYVNLGYTHSGWWSEDGRYVYLHDELDEQRLGLFTTLRVFDMSNLRAPVLAGSWVGPTRAIDHNGYAKGNRYYISNYSEGLTVLDLTHPTTPQRIGYFDTYALGSPTEFVGAWGVYPFFASGTIAVGDINTGLYLLKNETLATPNGTFAISPRVVTGVEGANLLVPVTRTGGATGAVSVQLELLYGTAGASDASTATTVLNWADGDTQPKSIELSLAADAQAEDMELFFVRLKSPQGGATINYPDTAHVYLAESGATTKLRLVDSDLRVNEVRNRALVTVARTGSLMGGAQVSYRTLPAASYPGFTATQGDLVWANGDADAKTITVPIDATRLVDGQTGTFQVELFSPANATLESGSASVSTLTATVTVLGEGQATAPPPPPVGNDVVSKKKGGGALLPWWLAAFALLAGARSHSPSLWKRARSHSPFLWKRVRSHSSFPRKRESI